MRRLWWWLHDRYWIMNLWFTDVRTPRVVLQYVQTLQDENIRLSEELWAVKTDLDALRK